MIDYKKYLEQILNGYRSSYDIEVCEGAEEGLVATGVLHVKQVQKFILKEFQMYSASDDEYVYFYYIPKLTEEIAQKYIQDSYDDGFPKIDLEHTTFRQQHMCTRLVPLILCDEADDAALKVIRKCRIRKSFQFSLKGWMEVHTLAVMMNDGSVVSNPAARETAKFLKKHVKHYMANVQK